MQHTDVVVVGAGPTGLLLASELALQGAGVVVLERLPEPDTTIKAGSINVASAEILQRRGLLPALEDAQRGFFARVRAFGAGSDGRTPPALGAPSGGARRFPAVGHFAGLFFRDDLVDQDDPVLRAHTAVAGGVLVPQRALELVLAEHCARLGVEVRRGVAVREVRSTGADLDADADLRVRTDDGDLDASWVVGADGGRSTVRRAAGIELVGTGPQMVGYQAVADLDDPSGLQRGWTWTPRGIYAYGPVPGRVLVAKFGPLPADRDAPVTVDELQTVLREVTGLPLVVTALRGRATRWSDNTRQASTYRRGRLLLAGDAAHVHPPFSGQGLNLGLGDAVNLGWKLAATVRGTAVAGLLDTYDAERRPVAAWVLDWTRAQVALMRGDVGTQQLRDVLSQELLTVPGATNRFVALTAGILQHYDVVGPGEAVDPRQSTGSVVGSVVGDVELADGGWLADHAYDGRFVLLDRTPYGGLAHRATGLDRWLTTLADPSPDGAGDSLLVRPDGVVLWASARSGPDVEAQLGRALGRWLGPAAQASGLITSSGARAEPGLRPAGAAG